VGTRWFPCLSRSQECARSGAASGRFEQSSRHAERLHHRLRLSVDPVLLGEVDHRCHIPPLPRARSLADCGRAVGRAPDGKRARGAHPGQAGRRAPNRDRQLGRARDATDRQRGVRTSPSSGGPLGRHGKMPFRCAADRPTQGDRRLPGGLMKKWGRYPTPLGLPPAMPALYDESPAFGYGRANEHVAGLSLVHADHGFYHRIQAPVERAIAASSPMAQVKCARFAFTLAPLSGTCTWTPASGRSSEEDPWLCVPASRRVCPGQSPSGG
jgi:hypothetical protein